MASFFNTLRRLFDKPEPRPACGPVTAALRAIHAEFGGQ